MPQIYVIYRPEDTRKKSKEIIAALQKTYGEANIQFPDFDGYVDVYQIERAVQQTNYLLVLIGNYWADLVDEGGQNLLADVYDPVHMAIATAIQSKKRIVPILIDDAKMPSRHRLPRELRPMVTQEPVKLDKTTAISKSLNKGLKDIIKRESLLKIPDFGSVKKVAQRTPASRPQPRLRQPTPQRDLRTIVKNVRLAVIVVICFLVILVTLVMIVPMNLARNTSEISTVTPVLATVAPSSTATTMTRNDSTLTESAPQIVTPTRQQITLGNVEQLVPMNSDVVSLATTDQFIFSEDMSLFIFAAPDEQEIQMIDVATNAVLRTISTTPNQPLVIQFNRDETLLYILMSNGDVVAWGVYSD